MTLQPFIKPLPMAFAPVMAEQATPMSIAGRMPVSMRQAATGFQTRTNGTP
jgi:hypothetical protein